MTIPQDPGAGGFDQSLHDVKEALDVLTASLGEVRGCEYPRLIAREIQALIVACIAHDKARQTVVNGATPSVLPVVTPPADDAVRLTAQLQAREAEISRLRELLQHGVATIEAHTLTDADGTAVMLHGDYQCISATALEQWMNRAEAMLQKGNHSRRGMASS
jgi:hypothetical protein